MNLGFNGATQKAVGDTLLILPSLPLAEHEGDRYLTQKFIDGAEAFATRWPGDVHVHTRLIHRLTDNLDSVTYSAEPRGFSLSTGGMEEAVLRPHLEKATVVLGAAVRWQNHVQMMCRAAKVPIAIVTEYTLRTRLQIVATEEKNPMRRAYRSAWEYRQEQANRKAVSAAEGVQANGVPTFEEYREICDKPILYYDTRMGRDMVVDDEAFEARLAELDQGAPLRLGFSGRLNTIKGADDLVRVAHELDKMHIPFTLTVSGGGPLEGEMKQQVQRLGLADRVHFNGILEFSTELIPWTKRNIDLYVMCHRQGDPSCTYHETLACGVPVVGYANEALEGMLDREPVGEATPMNDPTALANVIAALHNQRERLKSLSRAGRAFAKRHSFEDTMDARVAHLLELARYGSSSS